MKSFVLYANILFNTMEFLQKAIILYKEENYDDCFFVMLDLLSHHNCYYVYEDTNDYDYLDKFIKSYRLSDCVLKSLNDKVEDNAFVQYTLGYMYLYNEILPCSPTGIDLFNIYLNEKEYSTGDYLKLEEEVITLRTEKAIKHVIDIPDVINALIVSYFVERICI
jgi:hypothetical protein